MEGEAWLNEPHGLDRERVSCILQYMAERAPRPCSKPGCAAYQVVGGYCDEHRHHQRRLYDERRGSWRERGYDYRWDKVRNRYIRREPMCEYCGDAPATEVDHVVPIKEGGAMYDPENLKSSCHP